MDEHLKVTCVDGQSDAMFTAGRLQVLVDAGHLFVSERTTLGGWQTLGIFAPGTWLSVTVIDEPWPLSDVEVA